jgi:hypothetical protein
MAELPAPSKHARKLQATGNGLQGGEHVFTAIRFHRNRALEFNTVRSITPGNARFVHAVSIVFADGSSCDLDADSARSQQHLFDVLGALHASQGSSR